MRDGKGARCRESTRAARRCRCAGSPGPVELVVEAAANPLLPQFRPSPLGSPATAGDRLLYTLDRAELVWVDSDAEALLHDLDVLDGVMRALALDDPRRARIRASIVRALDLLARPPAAATTRPPPGRRWSRRSPSGARASAHRVIATGHAHIDTAWLWPLQETVRKCTRTFASAVALMDADPDFRFSCSQAQQYAWIAEREPELFARIADKVAAGQWVPVGGMWVEPDMNLPSGESIVRQIVHGQRFFEAHFGMRCREVWIPDVFGYPAGLPQVFAAGGMRRFVTQKLSWNRTNRFPHSTFFWEGIDGTRVLTHFPPVDTYNAEVTPAELARATSNFAEHAWSNWSLLPFGYGDGGGGPTREMLERARRLADLDGMPRVELGTAAGFFERSRPKLHGAHPCRCGGASSTSRTTAARSPASCAPSSATNAASGCSVSSSCGRRRRHRRPARARPRGAVARGAHAAVPRHPARARRSPGSTPTPRPPTPASAPSSRSASVPASASSPRPGRCWPTSPPTTATRWSSPTSLRTATGRRRRCPTGAPRSGRGCPGSGLAPAEARRRNERVVVTDRSMTNGRLAVAWDLHGNLRSVIDVGHARELLPDGRLGAVLELAPDHPVRYDAWDVEAWVRARARAADRRRVRRGRRPPDRSSAWSGCSGGSVRRRPRSRTSCAPAHRASTCTSSSTGSTPSTCCRWRSRSTSGPTRRRAASSSGAVARPTHPSTSWDAAKFEVCAHRYVDVAEPSLRRRRAQRRALRPRPVRRRRPGEPRPGRPSTPTPTRTRVTTRRRSACSPTGRGAPTWSPRLSVSTSRCAPSLTAGAAELAPPVVRVTGAGVEVDAVKLADDGSGDLVVRLHEACGDRARVSVRADGRITAASRCNLLEEPGQRLRGERRDRRPHPAPVRAGDPRLSRQHP